jgi:hypothetical protein
MLEILDVSLRLLLVVTGTATMPNAPSCVRVTGGDRLLITFASTAHITTIQGKNATCVHIYVKWV